MLAKLFPTKITLTAVHHSPLLSFDLFIIWLVKNKVDTLCGLLSEQTDECVCVQVEITGVLEEREESAHPGLVGAALGVMELVRQQCAVVHSASNALYRAARQHRPAHAPSAVHLLEFGDGNLVTLAALTQAITPDPSTSMCKVIIFFPGSRNVTLDFI